MQRYVRSSVPPGISEYYDDVMTNGYVDILAFLSASGQDLILGVDSFWHVPDGVFVGEEVVRGIKMCCAADQRASGGQYVPHTRIHPTTGQTPQPVSTIFVRCSDTYFTLSRYRV